MNNIGPEEARDMLVDVLVGFFDDLIEAVRARDDKNTGEQTMKPRQVAMSAAVLESASLHHLGATLDELAADWRCPICGGGKGERS
jgi:hypothetical protein